MSHLPLLSAILVAQAAVSGGLTQETPPAQAPPAWVVEGVPDTVWVLVEGTYAEEDDDVAKEMMKEAEIHARAATVGYETDLGRRFALAVVLGRRADMEGGKTKVNVASDFHKELKVVLDLDPEHPQARYLMGRLYAGVRRMGRVTRWLATNLLGGSELKAATWEAAEGHLVFAEQKQPHISDYHLQLAHLYKDTDREELALVELQHVLAIPANTPLEVSVRDEATELEEKLTN